MLSILYLSWPLTATATDKVYTECESFGELAYKIMVHRQYGTDIKTLLEGVENKIVRHMIFVAYEMPR